MIIVKDRYFYLNGRKFKFVPDWELENITSSMQFGNRFFSGTGQFVPADMLESIFAEIYAFSPSFPELLRLELREEWARINGQLEETKIDDSVAFLISRDLYEQIHDALIDVRFPDVPDEADEPIAANV